MQDINLFDPTVEKLQALVLETAGIVEVNIDDPKQIETVKKARIKLRDARVAIEKTGKAYREDALKYQKAVIEKEKSLVAIVEKEETRLKVFEKSAEIAKERRMRVQQLPERKKRLIDLGINIEEKYILEMDSLTFESSVNDLVAEKNRKEREEQDRIAREKEAELKRREDEVKAKEEAAERNRVYVRGSQLAALGMLYNGKEYTFEDVNVHWTEMTTLNDEEWNALITKITPVVADRKKAADERIRKDERERLDREAQEKADREKRDADFQAKMALEEKAKLEKLRAFKKFLTDNGVTKENATDFKQDVTDTEVVLWKKIAVYKV